MVVTKIHAISAASYTPPTQGVMNHVEGFFQNVTMYGLALLSEIPYIDKIPVIGQLPDMLTMMASPSDIPKIQHEANMYFLGGVILAGGIYYYLEEKE